MKTTFAFKMAVIASTLGLMGLHSTAMATPTSSAALICRGSGALVTTVTTSGGLSFGNTGGNPVICPVIRTNPFAVFGPPTVQVYQSTARASCRLENRNYTTGALVSAGAAAAPATLMTLTAPATFGTPAYQIVNCTNVSGLVAELLHIEVLDF